MDHVKFNNVESRITSIMNQVKKAAQSQIKRNKKVNHIQLKTGLAVPICKSHWNMYKLPILTIIYNLLYAFCVTSLKMI